MNLLVRGRRVVVVGAGAIAARKIEPLLDAAVRRSRWWRPSSAPRCGRGPPGGPRSCCTSAASQPADLDGAWLAFTATDDPAVNAAVHAAGEAARVWVNSADDPANCSFTLMSVIRRGDLVVSVGTGGRSPALAAHLRGRSKRRSDLRYEMLLDLLSEAREALRASRAFQRGRRLATGLRRRHR